MAKRCHFSQITAPNPDFCTGCGALLVIPDFGKHVECGVCKNHTPVNGESVTHHHTDLVPRSDIAVGADLKDKSLFSSTKPRSFAPELCFGGQAQNKQDQLATVRHTPL